jgi:glutamate-1-semialdehyde 2,1-aminomutase
VSRHEELFARAQRVIPGGVNSPVRAYRAVGGTPVFFESGNGARLIDVEGREYIDCVASWGPLILGHRHPEVEAAVIAAARRGATFGAPTAAEVELAELITQCMPAIERVRLTSSGTEACLAAARLARGFTGRDRLVKFRGSYHGHGDSFLVQSGSGALTFGVPSSPGVPADLARLTLTAPYNDIEATAELFAEHGKEIAAVIVEPVAANMGVVPPRGGFLQGLRTLCDEHGALLIFDEVVTGFRVGLGGAQELYGVRPDLTTLGKIIGGGLPVGAFGGSAAILEKLAPDGPVYQAGTLSGNPLATAAGAATIKVLSRPGVYERLEEKGRRLEEAIAAVLADTVLEKPGLVKPGREEKKGQRQEGLDDTTLPLTLQRLGSMATIFFAPGPVENLDSLAGARTDIYARFFHGLLERGVYFPPAQFEAFFLSLAHSDGDIDQIARAVRETLASLEG